MRNTYRAAWAKKIYQVHKTLPEDATLSDRMRALKAITPSRSSTSWGKKSWQAARRDYLKKYGYRPKLKTSEKGPLEDLWTTS